MLLFLGPLIEEFLFRFAYVEPIRKFIKNNIIIIIYSGIIFSLSLANALRYVPDDFKTFVYFQSGYTFILGFFCMKARLEAESLTIPILMHMLFNLGFYFGAV